MYRSNLFVFYRNIFGGYDLFKDDSGGQNSNSISDLNNAMETKKDNTTDLGFRLQIYEQSGAEEHLEVPNEIFDQDFFVNYDIAKTLTSETTPNDSCHYSSTSNGFIAFILFNFIGMFIIPFLVSSLQV